MKSCQQREQKFSAKGTLIFTKGAIYRYLEAPRAPPRALKKNFFDMKTIFIKALFDSTPTNTHCSFQFFKYLYMSL